VLAPVIERDGEAHLLFTKRAAHLGEHPGQMSFPGGGREPIDRTLTDTALREADEEVGMRPGEVDVVGRLDDTRTSSAYRVRPFVGVAPDREYVPDESEVAEVAVLPTRGLTDRPRELRVGASRRPSGVRRPPSPLLPRRRLHRLGRDGSDGGTTAGADDRLARARGGRSGSRRGCGATDLNGCRRGDCFKTPAVPIRTFRKMIDSPSPTERRFSRGRDAPP